MNRCSAKDSNMINNIIKHDDVWPFASDDSMEDRELVDFKEALSNPNVYILSGNKSTMFMYIPINMITFDVHISSTPSCRGKAMIKLGKQSVEWMFKNTICKKLIASIPSFNRKAIIYAILCGFKKEGINEKSYLKNGILYDQVYLGLCKEVS